MRQYRRCMHWVALLVVICGSIALLPGKRVSAATLKINAPLSAGRAVTDFQISLDGRWIVYRADQDTDEVFELYARALSGGAPFKLNDSLAPSTSVERDFQISPDSQRVVYRAHHAASATIELYSVRIAKSTPTRLNGFLVIGGQVFDFQISPDGQRVLYRATQNDANIRDLWSVPISGGNAVLLSRELSLGGGIDAFYVSPDSARVIYLTNAVMFSVPINGPFTTAEQVSLPGYGVDSQRIRFTSDSTRVLFLSGMGNDSPNLYRMPVVGPATAAVRMTTNKGAFRDAQLDYMLSLDDRWLVMRANLTGTGHDLYSIPISGTIGFERKLSGPHDGLVELDFAISSDSARVVYRHNQADTSPGNDLWSAAIDGSSQAVRLNPIFSRAQRSVTDFQIRPDRQNVVYRANPNNDALYELYSVPVAGGSEPLRLSGSPAAPERSVEPGFRITPDSSRVIFLADLDTDGVIELYSAALNAATPPTPSKLNAPLVVNGMVRSFTIGPVNSGAFYLADQEIDMVDEIFATPVAPVQASFAGDLTVSEAAGPIGLAVRLSAASLNTITVPFSLTGGSAAPGGDLTLPPGQLVFQPGVIERTIPITITQNSAVGPDEKIAEITLGTPTNATLGSPARATLTIRDDDDTITDSPTWLALLYLAGDDTNPAQLGKVSLTESTRALRDRLAQMKYNPAVRLVVLYDGNEPGDTAIYVREPNILRPITAEVATSPLWMGGIPSIPNSPGHYELDTGSPSTLRNFVTWARGTYPSIPHTFLSVVDHGGGWAPDFSRIPVQPRGGGGTQPSGGWRGMSLDLTNTGDTLSTHDTGVALNELGKFDVLFFDACLMGMLESAYEVRDDADYFIAAENLLFATLPYDDYFAAGTVTASTTPAALAQQIVHSYNAKEDSSLNPFTIAAVDLTRLRSTVPNNLANRVNALAEQLLDELPSPATAEQSLVQALIQAYSTAQKFDYDSSLSLDPHEGYVDLVDFVRRLRDTPNISQQVKDAAKAVEDAAVGESGKAITDYNAKKGVYANQPWNFDRANGLSIYLPLGEQDYRPTQTDPTDPSKPAAPERQLTYYLNPNQLAFTRDAPHWAELLARLEPAVLVRRAPTAVGAALSAPSITIDHRPFNAPYPVRVIETVYMPLTRH